MVTIKVQNQENRPDLIYDFDVTLDELGHILQQLQAGHEIIECEYILPDWVFEFTGTKRGSPSKMSFPARFFKGVKDV